MTGVGPELAPMDFLREVSVWRQTAEEKISLHAGIRLPADYAERILANSPT